MLIFGAKNILMWGVSISNILATLQEIAHFCLKVKMEKLCILNDIESTDASKVNYAVPFVSTVVMFTVQYTSLINLSLIIAHFRSANQLHLN